MYKPILKMFFTLSLLSFPISSTLLAQDIKMVEIPSGSFYMGSKGEGEDYDEAPIHKVIISHSFRMGET